MSWLSLSAGEVFNPPSLRQKLTLQQARDECEKHDSVLASPGHLYAAWRAGLDRCDYSWLSDGSARYPVTVPKPQCGRGQLGVRTFYKFENQTGYPDPTEKFGVFCFKGKTVIQYFVQKYGVADLHEDQFYAILTLDALRA